MKAASGQLKNTTTKKSSLLHQAKRWLSNKWTDWQTFYLPFARHFLQSLGAKGEIVFVMDGSQTGSANTTLMLSVLFRGFAIPVAWVVKKGGKGHFPEEMHTDLLRWREVFVIKKTRWREVFVCS